MPSGNGLALEPVRCSLEAPRNAWGHFAGVAACLKGEDTEAIKLVLIAKGNSLYHRLRKTEDISIWLRI